MALAGGKHFDNPVGENSSEQPAIQNIHAQIAQGGIEKPANRVRADGRRSLLVYLDADLIKESEEGRAG